MARLVLNHLPSWLNYLLVLGSGSVTLPKQSGSVLTLIFLEGIIDINLNGAFYTAREAARYMVDTG